MENITTHEEQVWQVYVELGQFERHFSSHQVSMRTLASTWLLASFAGIGFAITETLQMDIPVELLVSGICVVSTIGLILLWILDLLVYQRLLDAAYIVGLKLEKENKWLPQVRNVMRYELKGKAVFYSRLYYFVAIAVMLVISAISLCYWLRFTQSFLALIFTLFIYAIVIYLVSKKIAAASPTTLEMEKQIEAAKKQE